MADRLATGYNRNSSKNKYIGYTDILLYERVPKSDVVCDVGSFMWEVRLESAETLELLESAQWNTDAHAVSLLKWLVENSFSVSSYCYNKGNTDKRYITEKHVKDLQDRIVFYKKKVKQGTGKAYTDFVRYDNDTYGRQVERLNVTVRNAERSFVQWMYDVRVVADLYQHLHEEPETALVRFNRMYLTEEFLNELSNFMFWMLRYHSLLYFQHLGQEPQVLEWESENHTLENIYE